MKTLFQFFCFIPLLVLYSAFTYKVIQLEDDWLNPSEMTGTWIIWSFILSFGFATFGGVLLLGGK